MSELLQVRDLSFAIGSKSLLTQVSFAVDKGSYFAIVGPNGAGKSTLLKIVARVLRGYQGQVLLEGSELRNVASRVLAQRIGYVPQLFTIEFPHSVQEFVLMGLYSQLGRFFSVTGEQRQQVQAALALTGTSDLAERRLSTLSGGERQRVLIAGALVHNPHVLLLDEPTAFLDPKHEFEVEALLREIRAKLGITVIAVTHNLNHCALYCDQVLALRAGKVVFQGAPRDLMQNHVLFDVFDHRFDLLLHPRKDFYMIVPRAE
ncbi:MAG: ABC transporter ATP-binding protein [Deltaproteobacteria bacterium]|nr:ABC transporter ATP-binding protein [Deltaproteobacteria bacterium]